jgi:eukaryotic-like serine/threonine-protein kinase
VPTPTRPPIPKRLGRYDIIDRLATGGMAEIFVACERAQVRMGGLERLVVVKRILPHLAVHESFVDMFLAEARFVARIAHPNIVQIYELGEDDEGAPYIAMEYVHGTSLRDLLVAAISEGKDLDVGVCVGIIAQACAGAHAAHELTDPQGKPLGLVHRDISPHNLMVTGDGHVKLLDFGIAKATEEGIDNTKTGALKGKVHYMSPEQCRQEQLDRRTDVFALGIVLWEMIAQERLFKKGSELDSMQAIVSGDRPPLQRFRADVPDVVVAAVEKALQPAPGDRYQSADEMRRALLAACEQAGLQTSIDAVAPVVKSLVGEAQQRARVAVMTAAERTMATPVSEIDPDTGAPLDDTRAPSGEGATTRVERKTGPPRPADGDAFGPATGSRSKSRSGSGARRSQSVSKSAPPLPPADDDDVALPRSRRTLVWAATTALLTFALTLGVVFLLQGRRPTLSGPPITVGWAPILDRAMLKQDVEPFRIWLEDQTRRPVELTFSTSYDELARGLLDGTLSYALLPPRLYVDAKNQDARIELLGLKLSDGAKGSDGVLLVPDSSTVRDVADLKGKRICHADKKSTTGFVFPRAFLRKNGIDPDRDLVAHFSGDHIQVLRDLDAGVCDVGGVYSGALYAADKQGIQVARMRTLAITGRSPQDGFTAGPLVPVEEKAAMKRVLLALDPMKAVGEPVIGRLERISGFAPGNDRDYDDIRAVVAAEAAADAR